MKVPEEVRNELIKFKEKFGKSNREIGELFDPPCTAQAVGKWIVNKDSNISYERCVELKDIIGFEDSKDNYLIRNTDEIKNLIFRKSMQKKFNFDDIAEKMGKNISPNELEELLSHNGADFTPKTLSLLCAILDIDKNELPIDDIDKNKLYIHAMKTQLLLKEVPICNEKHLDDVANNKISNGYTELYWVAGLEDNKNKTYIGYKYLYDDVCLGLAANDILILSNEKFVDGDLVVAKVKNKIDVGFFKYENLSLESEFAKVEVFTRDSMNNLKQKYKYAFKVVKVIRDLQ